jgi:hypothetical protein
MGGLPTPEAARAIAGSKWRWSDLPREPEMQRVAPPRGWQPIETAPVGAVVDVWGVTPLSGTTYEWRGRTHKRPEGERRTNVMLCPVHRCWRVAKDMHFLNTLSPFTPTHWMFPLEPPR